MYFLKKEGARIKYTIDVRVYQVCLCETSARETLQMLAPGRNSIEPEGWLPPSLFYSWATKLEARFYPLGNRKLFLASQAKEHCSIPGGKTKPLYWSQVETEPPDMTFSQVMTYMLVSLHNFQPYSGLGAPLQIIWNPLELIFSLGQSWWLGAFPTICPPISGSLALLRPLFSDRVLWHGNTRWTHGPL